MKPRPQMVCARGFFDRVPGHRVFLCCQTAMLNKHLLRDRVINAETGWFQPVSATSSATPPTPWSTSFPSPTLEVDSVERWARFFEVSGVTDYWPSLSLRNRYSGAAGKVLFAGRLYLVFFTETKLS